MSTSVTWPLLFLDVDGVLNPNATSPPPGYLRSDVEGFAFFYSEAHRLEFETIVSRFEIVWATTWETKANDSIGPALGIPSLDAVDLAGPRTGDTWKLGPVSRHVGDRPLVWIDDELHPDAFAWAGQRSAPTLLIRPRGSVGLRPEHFEQIRSFADERTTEPDSSPR